ncbi:stage III sporulation protein AH [Proteiniborus ethanoligenes]|uniref:Stage III sporulation protein AH n=1 Tax=Proteiniborus ethanoligenes TaxID=415015 RepID=A0A1H3K8E7_9FIRM|nr:SpoIIIAH-like family protein [Proteiniborus ethanoligenes]TAH63407.1 MAG: SpoIIIAH-like family protein [Gottschalkiaceae bacterium]SDY48373.1 stage III sporulation protein AH [Proteiniborus ethanoligenes]
MYIKKKTITIISLICLLLVVGYLNHELTKKSLLPSSNDYRQYEEEEIMELSKTVNEDLKETSNENTDNSDSIDIVDSRDNTIDNLKKQTDHDIEDVIAEEVSTKNRNYFTEYRLSRDKLRATLIDRLYEIINNENTNDEVRTKAQNEIISIGQVAELELSLEGLIKAKGYEDVLVFLSDDSVRVVVSINELTEQDVAKIFEIVRNETSIDASNIKIMKKF